MKIEITSANRQSIESALNSFQGKMTTGLISVDDIINPNQLIAAQDRLDQVLFKRDQVGAVLEIEILPIAPVPKIITAFKVAKGSKGNWYLVGFNRASATSTGAKFYRSDNTSKVEEQYAFIKKEEKKAQLSLKKSRNRRTKLFLKGAFDRASVSVSSVETDKSDGYFHIGNIVVHVEEHGEWNNNRYSKAYHRQYGGVWQRDHIEVGIYRKHGKGFVCSSHTVESFRGKWLTKIIIEDGLIKPVGKANAITLDKYHTAKRVTSDDDKNLEKIFDVKLYERYLLKGSVEDYVAVNHNGVTYHDTAPELAIKGLEKKVRGQMEQANKTKALREFSVITREYVKDALGFCEPGVNKFLEVIGYTCPDDIDKVKSVDLIKNIKATPRKDLKPFKDELKSLKNATGLSW